MPKNDALDTVKAISGGRNKTTPDISDEPFLWEDPDRQIKFLEKQLASVNSKLSLSNKELKEARERNREAKRLASIKPKGFKALLSWLGSLLMGPRYVLSSWRGGIMLLDQVTGETWLAETSESKLYSVNAKPVWVKMKGAK